MNRSQVVVEIVDAVVVVEVVDAVVVVEDVDEDSVVVEVAVVETAAGDHHVEDHCCIEGYHHCHFQGRFAVELYCLQAQRKQQTSGLVVAPRPG